jgi:hypothetical protein
MMNEQQKQEHIPDNHVVAVINGDASAGPIGQSLEREGFDHNVLFRGNEIAENIDPKGEHAGPLTKVLKGIQEHLSEQPNYLAQYQEEARKGNVVIAVQVENREQADTVRGILERSGAQNIRFFGKFAVHDLTPDTNPSYRSEESPEVQAKN